MLEYINKYRKYKLFMSTYIIKGIIIILVSVLFEENCTVNSYHFLLLSERPLAWICVNKVWGNKLYALLNRCHFIHQVSLVAFTVFKVLVLSLVLLLNSDRTWKRIKKNKIIDWRCHVWTLLCSTIFFELSVSSFTLNHDSDGFLIRSWSWNNCDI